MKKTVKRALRFLLSSILILGLFTPAAVYARQGNNGYEGGISSGEAPNRSTFEYQEVSFISGDPVIFKGTLAVKKTYKQDLITSTYTYNLKNVDKAATLTRVLNLSTKLLQKDNGQKVEETGLVKATETIKIKSNTYTLKSYDFSQSHITDPRPAINYYAGDLWGKKTYQVGTGTGTAAAGGTVTVEVTGNYYGYDEYWGSTETESLSYIIQGEQKKGEVVDKWGGTAGVNLSSSTTKQLKYTENKPTQISFSGGYVQTQYNNSILEYRSSLPEFDAKGVSTDRLITVKDSLKLETFPVQSRLQVPNLAHIRGHWAEDHVKTLFSLEVFKGDDTTFNPDQYMTRAEFITAVLQAAREVPPDPLFTNKTTARSSSSAKKSTEKPVSSFSDVSVEDKYFSQIDAAYKRGLITGKGGSYFGPNDYLKVADALTVLINAVGLEKLAPAPEPVTNFKDNDAIPGYARKAVYAAQRIGLVKADARGYLKPNDKLTKGKASELLVSFINYMRDGIRKDYRERSISY
jgi:N-acetylmuramoyl-L-alanine amidase